MIRKQTLNGKEVTLSNEGLKEGDEVFPISFGTTESGRYVHTHFDFSEACSGWHTRPHTIKLFYTDDRGIVYVRTDMGYSPMECYFKILEETR